VVLRQSGAGLTGCSLPTKEGSELKLELSLERALATGTWTERTSPAGYYHGSTTMERSSSSLTPWVAQ
jgi:hypothetical protein